MKILVIGSGAREHAIVKRLSEDSDVYCVMSKKNPGIAKLCKKIFLADIEKPEAVIDAIKNETFELAFASPDATLAAGVSDALMEAGIEVASPTKAAARIEWDKSHMRNLTEKYKVNGRIRFRLIKTEKEAQETILEFGEVAIKPLGLSGGKGVRVSGDHFQTIEEGMEYARSILKNDKIALIEEKIDGEEFSLMCFSDGKNIVPMPPVQDHKRAFLGDRGANTGGMGSYSTGPILPFLQQSDIDEAHKILQMTISAMATEGTPFKGVLYGQFMATKGGIKIIEFNSRFADPESMNVLALLESSLSQILISIAKGKRIRAKFSTDSTVVKYLVPNGYPDKPVKDQEVKIDEIGSERMGAQIYFASVYEKEGKMYLGGSRTFGILGRGKTLADAEKIAEKACKYAIGPIWHRTDIGTKKLVQKRIEHMRRIRTV